MEHHSAIIGVLALQGDTAEHIALLSGMGVDTREVRTPEDLAPCDRLIIPGGESTVMRTLLRSSGILPALMDRAHRGMLAIFGTCAGAILLAKEIIGKNAPEGLGLIDVTVDRNAYGTQLQSFHADITVQKIGIIPVAFIRAPKITRVGKDVEILASHEGTPVLVRQGRFLASACHPEVLGETAMHRYFLNIS